MEIKMWLGTTTKYLKSTYPFPSQQVETYTLVNNNQCIVECLDTNTIFYSHMQYSYIQN
jgi:hypothetical protein